jgi:hypothetical protein
LFVVLPVAAGPPLLEEQPAATSASAAVTAATARVLRRVPILGLTRQGRYPA